MSCIYVDSLGNVFNLNDLTAIAFKEMTGQSWGTADMSARDKALRLDAFKDFTQPLEGIAREINESNNVEVGDFVSYNDNYYLVYGFSKKGEILAYKLVNNEYQAVRFNNNEFHKDYENKGIRIAKLTKKEFKGETYILSKNGTIVDVKGNGIVMSINDESSWDKRIEFIDSFAGSTLNEDTKDALYESATPKMSIYEGSENQTTHYSNNFYFKEISDRHLNNGVLLYKNSYEEKAEEDVKALKEGKEVESNFYKDYEEGVKLNGSKLYDFATRDKGEKYLSYIYNSIDNISRSDDVMIFGSFAYEGGKDSVGGSEGVALAIGVNKERTVYFYNEKGTEKHPQGWYMAVKAKKETTLKDGVKADMEYIEYIPMSEEIPPFGDTAIIAPQTPTEAIMKAFRDVLNKHYESVTSNVKDSNQKYSDVVNFEDAESNRLVPIGDDNLWKEVSEESVKDANEDSGSSVQFLKGDGKGAKNIYVIGSIIPPKASWQRGSEHYTHSDENFAYIEGQAKNFLRELVAGVDSDGKRKKNIYVYHLEDLTTDYRYAREEGWYVYNHNKKEFIKVPYKMVLLSNSALYNGDYTGERLNEAKEVIREVYENTREFNEGESNRDPIPRSIDNIDYYIKEKKNKEEVPTDANGQTLITFDDNIGSDESVENSPNNDTIIIGEGNMTLQTAEELMEVIGEKVSNGVSVVVSGEYFSDFFHYFLERNYPGAMRADIIGSLNIYKHNDGSYSMSQRPKKVEVNNDEFNSDNLDNTPEDYGDLSFSGRSLQKNNAKAESTRHSVKAQDYYENVEMGVEADRIVKTMNAIINNDVNSIDFGLFNNKISEIQNAFKFLESSRKTSENFALDVAEYLILRGYASLDVFEYIAEKIPEYRPIYNSLFTTYYATSRSDNNSNNDAFDIIGDMLSDLNRQVKENKDKQEFVNSRQNDSNNPFDLRPTKDIHITTSEVDIYYKNLLERVQRVLYNIQVEKTLLDRKDPRYGELLDKYDYYVRLRTHLYDVTRFRLKNNKNSNYTVSVLHNIIDTLYEELAIINPEKGDKKRPSGRPIDIATIKERVYFLHKIITGLYPGEIAQAGENPSPMISFGQADEYTRNVLTTKINDLLAKLDRSYNALSDKIVREDITIFNNFMKDDKKIELLEKNKTPTHDIGFLEKYFLGITQSYNNDGILMQVAKSQYETNLVKLEGEVNNTIDELIRIIGLFDKKEDFQWIFERSSTGARTGNIISLYTPKFRDSLAELKRQINDNPSKSENLKKQWLLENAEVIDFRKIKEIRELFGHEEFAKDHFYFSDEEMDAYEDKIRELLGDEYDTYINNIILSLSDFRDSYMRLPSGGYEQQYHNPFNILTDFFFDENTPKSLKLDGTMLINLNKLSFIPKQTINVRDKNGNIVGTEDSGYYNEDYRKMMKDPNKKAYIEIIHKSYRKHIAPTYEMKDGLSYAKFKADIAENVMRAQGIRKMGTLVQDSIKAYADSFYEQGKASADSRGIVKNYIDGSDKEISMLYESIRNKDINELKKMARKLGLKNLDSVSKDVLAMDIASEEILQGYSMAINKTTISLLQMSAIHKARVETLPYAELLFEQHKKYRTKQGNLRKNSIERAENYINKVIKNHTHKYRDTGELMDLKYRFTWLDAIVNKLAKINWISEWIKSKKIGYNLSENEQKILKVLREDLESNFNENSSFNGRLNNERYIQELNTVTGEMVRYKLVPLNDGTGGFDRVDISFEDLKEARDLILRKRIEDIGLDLNTAGVIQGILKTIIIKGLGLNPISGFFNRLEGKFTNLIMDLTEEYWTSGNMNKVGNFMAFANFLKFKDFQFSPKEMEKVQQHLIFQKLLQRMNILQDRKDPLERNRDKSNKAIEQLDANLFAWSVDNPEYKNQGSIILAILMDTKILNKKTGKYDPIFDGKKFLVYEKIDKSGRLKLKEEYRTNENVSNWEKFQVDLLAKSNNQYLVTRNKMKSAISHSQGNYDGNDTIMATRTLLGQVFMLFKRWIPEHFMQRFAKGEGVDIFVGKKRPKGRYRHVWTNNGALFVSSFAAMGIGLGTGVVTLGAGALTLGVCKLFFNYLTGGTHGIKSLATDALHMFTFMKSILIGMLNTPLQLFNTGIAINHKLDGLNKLGLEEEQANALRAVAKEIGIILTLIGITLLVKMGLWDDDDEKDSTRRQFHNFMDNQLNRQINSITNWVNPKGFYDDFTKTSMYMWCESGIKMCKSILDGDFGKGVKEFGKMTPLPRIISNPVFGDESFNPFLNSKEYDKGQGYWDTFVRDWESDGEYSAEKEYKKVREEVKDKIKKDVDKNNKNASEESKKKKVAKKVAKKLPPKKEKETYQEATDRIKKKNNI